MTLAQLIARIAAECGEFATVRSAFRGAPALAADADWPAALVAPTKMAAERSEMLGAVDERVTAIWSVFVLMPREGVPATDTLFDDLTGSLRTALVGWVPAGSDDPPLQYAGGEYAQIADGLAAWREDFVHEYRIRR